jgi:Ser/Thr protein kinase RdoA (MazF antagonist)
MPEREVIARGMRSEIIAWEPGKVLKLYHAGWSAAAFAGEVEATAHVFRLGIPAPRLYGTVELDGRHGIILERLTGPTLGEALMSDPRRYAELARMAAGAQAAVHAHEVPEASPQLDQLRRKINSPRSPLASELKRAATMAAESLPRGTTVCHGDLHGLNIIISAERGPVIIDWDSPTAGNPICDLARTLLVTLASPFHAPPEHREYVKGLVGRVSLVFLRTYFRLRPENRPGRRQLRTWLWINAAARLVEGITPEEQWLTGMVRAGAAKS